MLVLTRRVGERLRIGQDIEVVVLEVRGREARLGITAPASVPIHREEIYLKLQEAAGEPLPENAKRPGPGRASRAGSHVD